MSSPDKTPKVGALVYIVGNKMMGDADNRILNTEGRLWRRVDSPQGYYSGGAAGLNWYRSLATGEEWCWFNAEVEEHNDE
jgi:hypothetical protein